MKRRTFFRTLGMAGSAAAIASLPLPALANDSIVEITEEISFNHGHAVDVNIADVLALLQETHTSGQSIVDIQGLSGHPHTLTLNHQEILDLLINSQIEVTSSVDAGHAHTVTLTMTLTES